MLCSAKELLEGRKKKEEQTKKQANKHVRQAGLLSTGHHLLRSACLDNFITNIGAQNSFLSCIRTEHSTRGQARAGDRSQVHSNCRSLR